MNVSNREVVIFVLGAATTEKTTLAARLFDPDWSRSIRISPPGYLKSMSYISKSQGIKFRIVDTPGFDNEGTYDQTIFQMVENMFEGCVPRMRSSCQQTATPIHFNAVYCYPMAADQLNATTRRDLQALVALCKVFDFDSFIIFPVWPSHVSANQKQLAMLELLRYQQIIEIWNDGGEIIEPDSLPKDVIRFITSKAKPFNIPREGVNRAARLAYAKGQLQSESSGDNREREPAVEQLESRLRKAEEFNKSLLQSLALPAYNLERKTLANEFERLNRDISNIVKAIARHCKAERNIGVDKLLLQPAKLDAMHELLSNGRDDRSKASLYQSNTSQHMSVKLFLQSAAALILCHILHERVFQPFHPGLQPETNEVLNQAYRSVRNTNNDTMSGKWRRDTFIGLRQTVERTQEIQGAISLAIKEYVTQVLRILYDGSRAVSEQQQAAFSTLDRPFAPIDSLVRKAFDLNNKIKAEAVLIGSFSTLYYPPGAIFDSRFMAIDGAGEDRGDEETQRQEEVQTKENIIYSTFGLGLVMTSGGQTATGTAEQGCQTMVINRAVVTDESSCDVTYQEGDN